MASAVPNAYFERTLYMVESVDDTARAYFQGLLKLTVIDTVCLAVGLAVLGIPGALALGLMAAVFAWVPLVGAVLGCVVVVLITATDFPADPGMVYAAIALFVLVRLLDDFVFMPLTVGRSLRMHPLPTVLLIFVGGAVAGIPGLVVALPLAGVVMVIAGTIGGIIDDPRLRARHGFARALAGAADYRRSATLTGDCKRMRSPISAISPTTRRQRALTGAASYWKLTKPRVVSLIVFTAVVGMFLATPGLVPVHVLLLAPLGIALAAGSAAAFNHVLDRRADAIMPRTRARPLPTGQLMPHQAVIFASVLAALSMAILFFGVNALTAVLTFLSIIGYAVVYTFFLKPSTSQNIVIGGAAGAAPPVLGWTAVTGTVSTDAVLLFLIIFVWTPPHFWSLALYRAQEYAKAGIPMLPVTHGSQFTRRCILAYTVVLALVTADAVRDGDERRALPVGAAALNARFIAYAWKLNRNYSDALARKTFRYSIQYLAMLFALLLADHYRGVDRRGAARCLRVKRSICAVPAPRASRAQARRIRRG